MTLDQRFELLDKARYVVKTFCQANKLTIPEIKVVDSSQWDYDPCAYYRPKQGIVICVSKCAKPCGVNRSRQWSWPASVTDRTPYGVVAHELGHHVDYCMGATRQTYFSEYGSLVRFQSKERPLTSYCPNDAEWFAEMFRLFVTNHALLAEIRPKTHGILFEQFESVSADDWRVPLGKDVPERVVQSLINKMR